MAAIIAILVLGIVISVVSVLGLRRGKAKVPARRARRGLARAEAARRYPERTEASGQEAGAERSVAHARNSAHGGRAGAPDLTCLEPPPDGTCLLEKKPIDPGVAGDILKSAEAMSQLVCRRTAILKAMSNLSQEPREVTKLVVADPTLAGQVLKTVNSAFYGLHYPVASVFRAVLLLGHVEVRNIIWRSCFSEGVGRDQGPTHDALDALWQHSFATSRVAYALAKSVGVAAPDDVSTAALLHDIGKVFCLKTKPFVGMALYGQVGFSNLGKLERELAELGLSHASLGSEIARVWGLPEESRAAIGLHHMPSYIDPHEVSGDFRAIGVVYLADVLCHAAARPAAQEGDSPIYLPRQAWLKLLGVQDGMEQLCTESVIQALTRPARAMEMAGTAAETAYSTIDL